MAIQYMSLQYSPSGRKRKKIPTHKTQAYRKHFQPLTSSPTYRRDTVEYPSKEIDWQCETLELIDTTYRQEVSAKYTIAPAYNKGAYQVISKDNVEDIGK